MWKILLDVETNQEGETANISAVAPDAKAEIVLAILSDSKMIFLGDHTPVRQVLLQDAKILVEIQGKLDSLINTLENIMSSSWNDIGYTKSIKIDIETDTNYCP